MTKFKNETNSSFVIDLLMRTILFACRNFDRMAGGVERIASLLMNEMVNRGNKVVLITWDNSDSISHYFLN